MLPIFVSLDLETTGTDPARDTIIEIGAVKFRGEEVLDQFSTLVHPGRPVPHEITVLTGIRDEDVADAPRLASVLPRLAAFVGDRTLVGHSVDFDLAFLRRHGVLQTNRYLDTFKLASLLAPDARRYSLGELARLLGFPPPVSHRALDDARTVQQLFLTLFDRACALPPSLLEELVRLGERVDWPPAEFFRLVLRRVSQGVFTGTIGAQLAAKRGRPESAPLFTVAPEAGPLEPAPQRTPIDPDGLAALLQEDGLFARRFPNYEHRPQQVEMLRAVARAFNEGRQLIVEAPTGVGKSMAYLIPALHWAVQNSERVVVSTNTINLQEQLYRKDLPDLKRVLGLDFRAAVLKGRSHYLCPARLAALRQVGPSSPEEMDVLARVLIWLPNTIDGDGDSLFLPTPTERAIWQNLSAEFDGCDPERCRFFYRRDCFFYRAREAAEAAHLVIVNHALLLADVAVGSRVLPEYRHLIVDEAHHLEAATTSGLSFSTDRKTLRRLLEEVGHPREGAAQPLSGLLGEVLSRCRAARLDRSVLQKVEDFARQVAHAVTRAIFAADAFFDQLEQFMEEAREEESDNAYARTLRITPAQRAQPGWSAVEMAWDDAAVPLKAVAEGLQKLAGALEDLSTMGLKNTDDLYTSLTGLARTLGEIHDRMSGFMGKPDPQTIYWAEVGPGQIPVSVHAAPLHVGPLLREHIFNKKETVILTSATLRAGGSFDFLRERFHAWDAEELAVDSPFDYASSTLVYLVEDIPEPGQPGYQRAVEQGMVALFRATQGRALALFTSHSQLRATARAITAPLAQSDIVVFAQGQGLSRTQLLENFRTTERAVLLGTRSFWEGIDVPGEALSCLAIAKLPFNVPSDPIFAARSETFDEPFTQYAVPEAILSFLQGFGRLIRTRTDRGVVAVFDRRLLTRSYGRLFLDSLPGPTIRRGPLARLPSAAAEWLQK
ncbi:MAG: helicase C-terminal domain-containing protein [Anaerolineae bacterium]|nr:exonuclease domain-containing protein [Anaerolineae bacterium]MDW8067824.1 helicase C-terminal domain-containing protein [Anaerolineae bacterium]